MQNSPPLRLYRRYSTKVKWFGGFRLPSSRFVRLFTAGMETNSESEYPQPLKYPSPLVELIEFRNVWFFLVELMKF